MWYGWCPVQKTYKNVPRITDCQKPLTISIKINVLNAFIQHMYFSNPLGNMNICTNFHGNPSDCCLNMLAETNSGSVDQQDIAIARLPVWLKHTKNIHVHIHSLLPTMLYSFNYGNVCLWEPTASFSAKNRKRYMYQVVPCIVMCVYVRSVWSQHCLCQHICIWKNPVSNPSADLHNSEGD